MRIFILAGILIGALLVFLLVSGIADIPCQAGSWDPGKYTCTHTGVTS
ncbi:hypothetical protein FB004_11423 [Sinorhizobium medicae]|nr:hypothetical protein FB004_11423 [Sinorhizobium medicae]TWA22763.1 hypothetical protein FB006_10953 [Sinorhizobium medicae]TWA32429.1 hypothetical protein FB007_11016 [Sinorhizobium medicae]TWA36518.1 hypothetical protein FB009_11124 [Sinorhizobium medicae]TWA43061.1 hypothetical protein FB005_10953 [Sinorhizobium medicae]